MRFRSGVQAADAPIVAGLVRATGFFSPTEEAVAVELVHERLQKGAASGYEFLFLESETRVLGYTCFGLIPCTCSSYDLYWIVISPEFQGRGLGTRLLARTEETVRAAGGTRLYIDTSGRPKYEPTRAFYLHAGYRLEAVLEDFYAPGDPKRIFVKRLS